MSIDKKELMEKLKTEFESGTRCHCGRTVMVKVSEVVEIEEYNRLSDDRDKYKILYEESQAEMGRLMDEDRAEESILDDNQKLSEQLRVAREWIGKNFQCQCFGHTQATYICPGCRLLKTMDAIRDGK